VYQNFIIPYLYEAQHVSGDTPPIIRSLKPLAASGFAYVEGCWTCGCWTLTMPDNIHQLHIQQPSTYEKPEAASAGLGS